MSRLFFLMAALLALAASAPAHNSFVAQVKITDSNVWGTVSATLTYFYDPNGNHTTSRTAFKYTVAGGTYNEVIDYNGTSKYMQCGGFCQAEAYKNPFDVFCLDTATDKADATYTAVPTCTYYARSSASTSGITGLYVKSDGTPCRVIYDGLGKYIDFLSFSSIDAVTASNTAFDTSSWNCAPKQCNVIMDLVLIFDNSNSIKNSSWVALTSFSKQLVSQFTISPEAVEVGLVAFATSSRIVGQLDGNPDNVNTFLNSAKMPGDTCIGCGLRSAVQVFNAGTRSTTLYPKKVSIMLTDGENNTPKSGADNDLKTAAASLKATGAISIAVGVGKSVKQAQLQIVATSTSYIFNVNDYEGLKSLINQLVTVTCSDYPTEPCGTTCRGFCACNQTCKCPDCPYINKCYDSACTEGDYMSGCKVTKKSCDDNDACTDDTCFNETGCNHTTHNCDDSDPCTDDFCDTTSGCYHTAHKCQADTPCFKYACSAANNGCYATAVSCDDSKYCTVDSCNESLGGCVNDAIECDDGSLCTKDYCSEALLGNCSFDIIPCVAPDLCHNASCDKDSGCSIVPVDCNNTDPCRNRTCILETGVCTDIHLPCDKCLKLDCAAPNLCTKSKCVQIGEDDTGIASCVNTSLIDDPNSGCYHSDKCIVDKCDMASGQCSFDDLYKLCAANATNKCWIGTCKEGQCAYTAVNCTPSDACHTSECNPDTGACIEKPQCQAENCLVVKCLLNASAPEGFTCSRPPKNCSTGSACMNPHCNVTTGDCYSTAVSCPEPTDKCHLKACDSVTGCYLANVSCDDHNPCTVDTCDGKTGNCSHTPYCNDGKFCTDDKCSVVNGTAKCLFTALTCTLNLTETEKNCYKASCSERAHCYKSVINGAFTNPCGSCVATYASDDKDSTCFGTLTWPKFAGALAGGIIAGIVIAAVVGFAIFAAVSAFGTYKLIQMSKAGKGMVAQNNPMYKASENEMTNPAYAAQ